MNKHLQTPVSLAAPLLLFASAATAQTITDLPRIQTTSIIRADIHPRELTSLNSQVYFTAQDGTPSSEWNRRYLWSSTGNREGTSIVPSAKDIPIYPGVIPASNFWESAYTTPGHEMVALGSNLLLSTLDGSVALLNPTDSSVSTKPVKVEREWGLNRLPIYAPKRLNLYKAGNNAYTVAQGELFGIAAEPFSVSQLTNIRSTTKSDPASAYVSAFAPAGASIIYGVTQYAVGNLPSKPPLFSMLYSFNGQAHNKLNPFQISNGVPQFRISGIPEVVDVSEPSDASFLQGTYIGRFNGTSPNLVKLNSAPLQSDELVLFGPSSFTPSDSPFLDVLTRVPRGGVRLYRGIVNRNNSVSWSQLWAGVEDFTTFGTISRVKVFGGNVFIQYMMGQTIVVRADGSWRYVDGSDPDFQFVKLVLNTKELLKVGKLWFFSSADGKDLGVAKEVSSAKPTAWNPGPKKRSANPAPTPGVNTP
jgi:hypothetical protein